jgi:Na+/phosphate symporter
MRTTERKEVRIRFSNDETKSLNKQIDAVLDRMDDVGVDSDEYRKLMKSLERLTDIKKKLRREPVSRNTMILVAGNLLGILLIIAYEQTHVMTSKGFSHVIRPK